MLPGVAGALVLGLGKVTGPAVVDALVGLGIRVRVHESFPTEAHLEMAAGLKDQGVQVTLGEPGQAEIDELLGGADLVVPSPGVPPSSPILAAALSGGNRVISEIELGYRFTSGPIFAVTGTNGKTTTTALLAHILAHAGRPCVTAGNIGYPLVKAARETPEGVALVCEVSSFQLAFVEIFRPSIALVLNVADDHYDWHSGYRQYVAAKARITENQQDGDFLIVRAGDPGCLAIAANSRARVLGFGMGTPDEVRADLQLGLGAGADRVAGVHEGDLVIDSDQGSVVLVKLTDIRLQGRHNVENVMAAALAAITFGVPVGEVAGAVTLFEALPHRTAPVGTRNGVMYVDDSKATNPHATLRALDGLSNVVLIAGGRAKGLDLSCLAQISSALRGVVVMGEAAGELETVFAGLPVAQAPDVEEAVRVAAEIALPGDTVLLSPACSSLDQYSGYQERGNRFIAAVRAL